MNQPIRLPERILFYDGSCGLCDGFVQFALQRDKKHQLHFSPLQGHTAHSLLKTADIQTLHSVILFANGKIYKRSTAVLNVFCIIGYPWKILALFKIVPATLRDKFYDFIANHRYKWFGQKDACKLLGSEEKKFFLD